MGKNTKKGYVFRPENEELLEKIDYIAKESKRNRRQEMELALELHVEKFEKSNGNITIGDITQKGNNNTIHIGN